MRDETSKGEKGNQEGKTEEKEVEGGCPRDKKEIFIFYLT
jgi:hypothetical protein